MIKKSLIMVVGAFYVISMSYLVLGLVHIGFPNASKAEVVKGIFSLFSTMVSLCVAYLAYKASKKAAIATENAAESNRLALSIAEQSLFNATFERRLRVYKAMWQLNDILESIDRTIGPNQKNPEENYVDKQVIDRVVNLREALVFESKVLPKQLQKKISRFYSNVKHEISCQERPEVVQTQRCFHSDPDLRETIIEWKNTIHERNLAIKDLLEELEPYLKAP